MRRIGAEMPQLPEFAQIDPKLGKKVGHWIDIYVEYMHKISPLTPLSYHEGAALWLVSVAIARRLYLHLPWGFIYPNLYILLCAPSTRFRKSTSMSFALRIAESLFPELLAPNETTPEAMLSDMAGFEPAFFEKMTEAQKSEWRKSRDFCAQKGLYLDEFSGTLAAMGRDYNAGLMEAFLRFYDCVESYTKSTRSLGHLEIRNSYLSILSASTPSALDRYLQAQLLWTNGFWPRFAILTPETNKPDYKVAEYAKPPVLIKNSLTRIVNRLPRHKWPDAPKAIEVEFGEAANNVWEQYNKALQYDLQEYIDDERLRTVYGRLPTHLLKVAMIIATLDWKKENSAPVIEVSHLARGQQITEKWRASIHRLIMNNNSLAQATIEERILSFLHTNTQEGASFREIHNNMNNIERNELQESLASLVKSGKVEQNSKGPGEKGGRPTTKYRIKQT